jgi:hypothetical protein
MARLPNFGGSVQVSKARRPDRRDSRGDAFGSQTLRVFLDAMQEDVAMSRQQQERSIGEP